MAYEGLSRALIQIANDYGNTAEAERQRERARSEKLADRDDERAYQRQRDDEAEQRSLRMLKEQVKIQTDAELDRIKQLEPAKRRAALLEFAAKNGVEGNLEAMSDSELASRAHDKAIKNASAAASAATRAKYETEVDIRRDEMKSPETQARRDSLQAQRRELNTRIEAAKRTLNQLAPGVTLTTETDVARKYVDDWLARGPSKEDLDAAARMAVTVGGGTYNPKLSPEAKAQQLRMHAESWVRGKIDLAKEAAAYNRVAQSSLQMGGRDVFIELDNLMKRRNQVDDDLTKLNVTPDFGSAVTANSAAATPAASAAPSGVNRGRRVFGEEPPPTAPTRPASAGLIPFGPEIPQDGRAPAPVSTEPPAWWSRDRDPAIPGPPAPVINIPSPPPASTINLPPPPPASAIETAWAPPPAKDIVLPRETGMGAYTWDPQSGTPAPGWARNSVDRMPHKEIALLPDIPAGTPSSATPPRQEAEAWLAQNGIQLDSPTKDQLIAQYEMVASSTLPLDQKAAKVRELQQLALSSDLRSKAWAPRM